jgi:hypothetical protein
MAGSVRWKRMGELADVIVSQSVSFEISGAELARQKTLLIIVGGEVLYIADGSDLGNGAVAEILPGQHFSTPMGVERGGLFCLPRWSLRPTACSFLNISNEEGLDVLGKQFMLPMTW